MKHLFFSLLCLLPILSFAQPGYVNTIAGNGTWGFSGDGGPATSAMMGPPTGVAVDAAGNLYITDDVNSRIRKVSPTGIITTIASGFQLWNAVAGISLDASGNIFIIDSSGIRKVTAATGIITAVAGSRNSRGYSGDGGTAIAALLNNPQGVYVDGSGNVYISDGNQRIRKVNTSGIINTIAGTGAGGFNGDGGLATAAQVSNPGWPMHGCLR